ncbi:MAG: hypothetical protein ACKVKG_07630 [Alphaproteobacteria bacterium]
MILIPERLWGHDHFQTARKFKGRASVHINHHLASDAHKFVTGQTMMMDGGTVYQ